jgi:hypothetical protein
MKPPPSESDSQKPSTHSDPTPDRPNQQPAKAAPTTHSDFPTAHPHTWKRQTCFGTTVHP